MARKTEKLDSKAMAKRKGERKSRGFDATVCGSAWASLDVSDYVSDYHVPVLLREVLAALLPGASEDGCGDDDEGEGGGMVGSERVYLDCTLGGGGHTLALLKNTPPTTRVYAIDRDPEALEEAGRRLSEYRGRWVPILGNYRDALALLADAGVGPVDGLLLDAGVSSHQLDAPERGFSFRAEGPLDMRMGPDAQRLDHWIATHDEEEIGQAIAEYGEMPGSYRIARSIKRAFDRGEVADTQMLAKVIEEAAGKIRRGDIHPATLVFQALRIASNDELQGLAELVDDLPKLVKVGGRIAMISFHSLEDRIVKQGFLSLASDCECPAELPMCCCAKRSEVEILTKKPVTAQADELEMNPRARSAKLRVARRI